MAQGRTQPHPPNGATIAPSKDRYNLSTEQGRANFEARALRKRIKGRSLRRFLQDMARLDAA